MLQKVLGSHSAIHTLSEPWLALHPLFGLRESGIAADYSARLARIGVQDFLPPTSRKATRISGRPFVSCWATSIAVRSNHPANGFFWIRLPIPHDLARNCDTFSRRRTSYFSCATRLPCWHPSSTRGRPTIACIAFGPSATIWHRRPVT